MTRYVGFQVACAETGFRVASNITNNMTRYAGFRVACAKTGFQVAWCWLLAAV